MSSKLLTKHHLDYLSFKGGCTGSSESILVKIPHCVKSHVAAIIKLHVCLKNESFQENASLQFSGQPSNFSDVQ